MNQAIAEAIDELVNTGSKVLAGYRQLGNIDRHDLWFESARAFLAVNDPELEQRLRSVAPKYQSDLPLEPYGRAAYRLIQEQLEIVKLARYRLVDKTNVTQVTPKPTATWSEDLDKAIQVKPGMFGISVNFNELLKMIFRRLKR